MQFVMDIHSKNRELFGHFFEEVLDYHSRIEGDHLLMSHEKLPGFRLNLTNDSGGQYLSEKLVVQFESKDALQEAINRANFFHYRNDQMIEKDLVMEYSHNGPHAEFVDLDGRYWRFEAPLS